MITGVIFDLGSTLIHFDGDWPAVFEESLHALARHFEVEGLAVEPQALRAEFRRQVEASQDMRQQDNIERTSAWVLRKAVEALGADGLDEGVLDRALASLFAVSEARWVPMPGLHDVLAALRAE
ncbi:MAG: hypothetical protein MUO35_01455, partial [Anaerolineales bacterium]|nr:hypothetical protein [Anaerolineales bacterium]